MRVCPLCRSKYTDDSLAFCLQDGSPLVDESSEPTGEPTAVLHDAETIASGRDSGRIDVEVTRDDEERETQERIPRTVAESTSDRRPGTLWTVLATVAVMLVLFGILGGIGLVYYFSREDDRASSVSDSNSGQQAADIPTPAPSPSPKATVSPSPSATITPEPSPTADENFDPDEIKGAIGQRLMAWKGYTERLDLNGVISCYADTLDYYYSRGKTDKSFVRQNKGNALAKFQRIRIAITRVEVTAGTDGRSATAVFDKEWRFEGDGKVSTGKVRSQVGFKRYGEQWLITGEKDLKVYFSRSS